jgi:quercetin dioxygenase-like cupin family protein
MKLTLPHQLPTVSSFYLLLMVSLLVAQIVAQTPAANEVEITSEPSHHKVIENEYVRVFKVEVAPHAQTLMHRHRHDYFFVILGDTQVENDVAGKAPATLSLKDGEARFTPGNFAHIAKNLGSAPFRNVTIEIMQDSKYRQSPHKWDEERALHVLEGGTQDVMFVKDGVRVTDVQLQPGGKIPKHHHTGPHLLVAITDLDLRSDVEGKGPVPGTLKGGDAKWVPGGYTHTLTNTGKQPARFVTLEFPPQE